MDTADEQILNTIKHDVNAGAKMLLNKYQAPIYWHVRRLVVTHDDANDAVQETFIRAFRSIGLFEQNGTLKAWLYRIATNEALRLLSKRSPAVISLDTEDLSAVQAEPEADPYINFDDTEAIVLQRAIRSLPAKQQITFTLRYYDDMSYKEIGQATNSSEATAKVNYHLAKNKIAQYLAQNI